MVLASHGIHVQDHLETLVLHVHRRKERWEVEGVDEYAVSLEDKPADEEIILTEY